MTQCWQYYPRYRPSFAQLLQSLQGDVRKNFFSVSWYYSQRDDEASDAESDSLNLDDPSAETQPLHPSSLHSSSHLEAEHDLDGEYEDDDSCSAHQKGLVIDLPPPIPNRLSARELAAVNFASEYDVGSHSSPLLNGHITTAATSIASESDETDDSYSGDSSLLQLHNGSILSGKESNGGHSKAVSSIASAGQPPPSYNSATMDQPITTPDSNLWSADGSNSNSCNGSANGHRHYGANTLTSAC